jgi:hypothetical protein
MKICEYCSTSNKSLNKFCENCGKPIAVYPQKLEKATQIEDQVRTVVRELELRTWRPLRWLLKENYGNLLIRRDHLIFELKPAWSNRFIEILSKILSWGFNPLSFFNQKGSNQIKNLTTVSVFNLNWWFWKLNFLVVRSASFFGVYPFPSKDLVLVEFFMEELVAAATQATYTTRQA